MLAWKSETRGKEGIHLTMYFDFVFQGQEIQHATSIPERLGALSLESISGADIGSKSKRWKHAQTGRSRSSRSARRGWSPGGVSGQNRVHGGIDRRYLRLSIFAPLQYCGYVPVTESLSHAASNQLIATRKEGNFLEKRGESARVLCEEIADKVRCTHVNLALGLAGWLGA